MLTELKIKHAGPGFYADGHGLYLQVSKSGAKSWIYRYQLNGNRREMGIGSLDGLSVKEARLKVAEARKLVLNKIDPLARRKEVEVEIAAEKAALVARSVTFQDVASDHIEANRASWRNVKHATQWANTLATYAYPIFGKTPVAEIDDDLVLKVLTPIWSTKTETATRVRSRIEIILDVAKAKKLRQGDNPARWRGHLEMLLPNPSKIKPVKHHPALPYDKAAEFMCILRKHEGISALCLEFLILTACRSGEALGATWDEIDANKGTWIIPPERMKAAREHRVPLSPSAITVLEKAKLFSDGNYVFRALRNNKPMSDMSLTMLLRGIQPGITVHGFRSTFRDWAAEITDYPSEMAEMALAHAVENKVEAAYRRGDMFEKRRAMMADWDKWCGAGQ